MFDWFWSFLYQITKTLFSLIDGLIQCANFLCGVDPITVEGKEVDFLEYVLTSDQIGFAFRVAALLGIIVVVVFSVIAILRTLAKEKAEGTPGQIAGKAIKSILSFLFIPLIMLVLIKAGNVFMEAMYTATLKGDASLGDFLFKAFALESGVSEVDIDAFLADPGRDWRNTSDVCNLMDIGEFEFIYSWIAGGVILASVGVAMMYFVSRVVAIAILYIAAPFSIGASVLDDGARLKLWREQILIKFITGYGMMIAVNIFAMICLLVMDPDIVFFGKGHFYDYLTKLLLIAGGGVALKQSMALIGNLVSNGAGSNELRDTAISGGLGGIIKRAPGAGLLGSVGASVKQEVSGKAAQSILPGWAQRSYGNGSRGGRDASKGGSEDESGSGSHNGNSPSMAGVKNIAKDMINGGGEGNKSERNNSSNANNKNPNNESKGSNMVNNAINNVGKVSGDYDDLYDE